jgi:rSAM/selenodomain-associated transferase 2
MKINFTSIIVPVINEESNIGPLLDFLLKETNPLEAEIIVVDGGSSDKTCEIVKSQGVQLHTCECASRASQMNEGVAVSKGELLYFVHADTMPPKRFLKHITQAAEKGIDMGCFRFKFQSKHPLLIINSYCTRFDVMWCRGGDQTLFITRNVFDELGGYDTYYSIMEEYDLMRRAREKYSFKILPYNVKVSARKYIKNSWLRVQLTNMKAVRQFNKGVPPAEIKKFYKEALNPY